MRAAPETGPAAQKRRKRFFEMRILRPAALRARAHGSAARELRVPARGSQRTARFHVPGLTSGWGSVKNPGGGSVK